MDKDTLKQVVEYCLERAYASKDKEDKLFQQLQAHKTFDAERIDISADFYKESGRLNAFLDIANKLMDITEEDKIENGC